MTEEKKKAKGKKKKIELHVVSPYLNTDEAALFLKVKKSTVYSWIHKQKSMNFPVRYHGRKPMFLIKDLEQWSNERTV